MPIKVTVLPENTVLPAKAWETNPIMLAKEVRADRVNDLMISKVNGALFDLTRPLEGDCTLEFLDFNDDEGKSVFWHSSAHVLGEACERHYGCHLCMGPPIEDGFYYEMFMQDRQASSKDFDSLEKLCKSITKAKQQFERLVISQENLLEMFKVRH